MRRALGADIKEFYENQWPKGHYHDDWSDSIDPNNIQPDIYYDLNNWGVIVNDSTDEFREFSEVFTEWYLSQNIKRFIVAVSLDEANNAIEKIRSLGYTVLEEI